MYRKQNVYHMTPEKSSQQFSYSLILVIPIPLCC